MPILQWHIILIELNKLSMAYLDYNCYFPTSVYVICTAFWNLLESWKLSDAGQLRENKRTRKLKDKP